ncbi:ComEC/Rec2 family competence protein [Paracoccus sp. p4-l81]|uniref:ComEC/Rec2 family competence protein n=1 Tax=Paracoccus sp. p4-l81 TaxID=3342806 RepID=UPI0035BADD0A
MSRGRDGRMQAGAGRITAGLARRAAGQMLDTGQMFLWLPVLLSLGIGLWFALPFEPGALPYGAAIALMLAGLAVARQSPGLRLAGMAIALIAAGFSLAGYRAHHVAAPVLGFRYYGPIEGRLIGIDRSARDRLRLTLDQVNLRDVAPARLPAQVRVSLMGGGGNDLAAMARDLPGLGSRVMLTGHLGPPSGPAAPGSFDFRRQAWFDRLGAVGYSRNPVLRAAPAPDAPGLASLNLAADRLRLRLSAAMQEAIGGQAGVVASALMTGDRSGIAEATNAMMRASNLYHIVSISGLHMGMLAGFVFAAVRLALAGLAAAGGAVGGLVQRQPVQKIAALTALIAAALYMWLAGPNVATERAFVMVAVMLGAVLADRRALSLRALAIAALIILIAQPESLTEPGFQMSFAATAALILSADPWRRMQERVPALLRPVALLVVSSLIASTVTSPLAAAHFNRMAAYGLLANLLVVPVMGAVVMPAGVIAALLAPLGLAQPALWVMGLGTRWMLAVGQAVADLQGAVWAAPSPAWWVVPVLGFGACVVVLTRGGLRLAALGVISASALGWTLTPRPLILIAPEAEQIGMMTAAGRVLSKQRGGGFVAETWLAEDGDIATPDEAAARPAFDGPRHAREARIGGWRVLHLTGKKAVNLVDAACTDRVLIVTDQPTDDGRDRRCLLIGQKALRTSGALALDPDGQGGWTIQPANSAARLWSPAPRRRAPERTTTPRLAASAGRGRPP